MDFNLLEQCCAGAPVLTGLDGCWNYCQYDSSRFNSFFDCIGYSGIESQCVQVWNDTSSAIYPSSTPYTTNAGAHTGTTPPKFSWPKTAVGLIVLILLSVYQSSVWDALASSRIRSLAEKQHSRHIVGNDHNTNRDGSSSIGHVYPSFDLFFLSTTFTGVNSRNKVACEFSRSRFSFLLMKLQKHAYWKISVPGKTCSMGRDVTRLWKLGPRRQRWNCL